MEMKPAINVSSIDTMNDCPVNISIIGLKSCQAVTLHSYTTIESGNAFECVAQYVADTQGCISLRNDSSIGGSFIGNEPMGLFWAMKPSLKNKRPYARFAKVDVTTPLVVTIKAYDASIKSLEEIHHMRKKGNLDQLELASVKVNRWFMAPGTKRITLTMKKDGIHGTLFIPPGDGPFPGVVTMFGGFPGTMEFKASLLASHGFAALALAFYGVPGLHENTNESVKTSENFNASELEIEFKLEYFEKAVNFLSDHPYIDGNKGVAVMGLSFSSYIVLLMAQCIKNINCVIWVSGCLYPLLSPISYRGKIFEPEPFDMYEFVRPRQEIFHVRHLHPKNQMHPNYESETTKSINFYNKHDVAFLFIAGLDDENTPADYFINVAEMQLKQANHPNYQIIRYPGAGHLIEPPYSIHNHTTAQKHVFSTITMIWGGQMIPHCKAQEDSWQKQLDFLKSNLAKKSISKL